MTFIKRSVNNMCIASDRVLTFRRTKDKPARMASISREATYRWIGDDMLLYFVDGSIAIYRPLVNELGIFKSVNRQVSEK